MAFKPKTQPKVFTQREFVKLPTPEAGNQPARVSLIVDLGDQPQYFEVEGTKEMKLSEKRPYAQEVAVFADLVDQVVDYGGDIGQKQYRMMLNDQWFGEIKGFKFSHVTPRDAEGNIIQGKIPTFHPKNMLYRLAVATGCDHILGKDQDNNMNIEELLGKAFMLEVEVTTRTDKNGKKDDKGELITYTNVKGKQPSRLPMIKGKPMEAEELTSAPMLVSFDTATEEQVKMLRRDIIRKIQKANNYAGSQIEAVINKLGLSVEAGESSKGKTDVEDTSHEEEQHDDVQPEAEYEVEAGEDELPLDEPF